MRHYSARKRQSDGRWDYACCGVAVGYCRGYAPYGDDIAAMLGRDTVDCLNAEMEQRKDLYHTSGHETKQEACDCYKRYQLDHELRLHPKQENPSELVKCRVCSEFCSGYAMIGAYTMIPLCESHCTREEVENLYSVGESWES